MADSSHKPDDAGEEQRRASLFKPGQSGNPAGRPKGSRNKLSEEFLTDLLADWREGGVAALKAARELKPEIYCRMIASLLPKEFKLKNELSEFTDEQLDALGVLATALIRDAAGVEDEDRGGAGSKAVN